LDRDVRLPLQVGTSALWSGARSAATFLPALGLIAFGIHAIIAMGAETLGFAVLAFFLVCGGGLAYFSWRHFTLALRLRPSDVVLNAAGIRIVGGRERDELIAWSEIAVAQCRVTEADEPRVTLWFLLLAGISAGFSVAAESAVDLTPESKVRLYKLWLARKGEGDLLIAETERPSEERSFQALIDSLRAAGEPGDAPAPARVEGALHCTKCGAPVPPTEEPHATCTQCGAEVRVPEATRALLRSARTKAGDDASLHRSVRRLLDQPGATHVNVMMALAALPMFIAWPAALYVAIKQYSADALAVSVTLPLVVFPVATILGCFLLVRVRLANRAALRILTLDFGARAPSRKGDPPACRQCGAPLRDAPGEVVTRCLYCSAENPRLVRASMRCTGGRRMHGARLRVHTREQTRSVRRGLRARVRSR
jgi:DNA-directed RNA polymerase subunit RPC12/RpoP